MLGRPGPKIELVLTGVLLEGPELNDRMGDDVGSRLVVFASRGIRGGLAFRSILPNCPGQWP